METPAPEEFNAKVRRIAQLRAYGVELGQICHDVNVRGEFQCFLVVAADLYLSYAPFDLPERTEPTSPVSGEFTAR